MTYYSPQRRSLGCRACRRLAAPASLTTTSRTCMLRCVWRLGLILGGICCLSIFFSSVQPLLIRCLEQVVVVVSADSVDE